MKQQLVQGVVKRNFYLSNLYENIKVAKADTKTVPILVYQMGKVASTSLYETLKKLDLDASIYHLHYLKPAAINRAMQYYKRRFLESRRIDEHIIHSQYLRRRLDKGPQVFQPKWKIVTLVRDPVAQNVSKFFQELRHDPDLRALESNVDNSVEDLIQKYFNRFRNEPHPFTWLDVELGEVFNVDIPWHEFPKSNGFKIYTYEHVDILVLKVERLQECGEIALTQFLDIQAKDINFVTANEAIKRKQGDLYQRFKQCIEFSPDYLNRMYGFSRVEDIYSEVEIRGFYRRWQ